VMAALTDNVAEWIGAPNPEYASPATPLFPAAVLLHDPAGGATRDRPYPATRSTATGSAVRPHSLRPPLYVALYFSRSSRRAWPSSTAAVSREIAERLVS